MNFSTRLLCMSFWFWFQNDSAHKVTGSCLFLLHGLSKLGGFLVLLTACSSSCFACDSSDTSPVPLCRYHWARQGLLENMPVPAFLIWDMKKLYCPLESLWVVLACSLFLVHFCFTCLHILPIHNSQQFQNIFLPPYPTARFENFLRPQFGRSLT